MSESLWVMTPDEVEEITNLLKSEVVKVNGGLSYVDFLKLLISEREAGAKSAPKMQHDIDALRLQNKELKIKLNNRDGAIKVLSSILIEMENKYEKMLDPEIY